MPDYKNKNRSEGRPSKSHDKVDSRKPLTENSSKGRQGGKQSNTLTSLLQNNNPPPRNPKKNNDG